MPRRLFLAFVLITAGFVGGLLLTARLHIAADSSADDVVALPAPAPPMAASGQARPVTPAAPMAVSVGPDFTRVAGQAVKGVANISSLQVTRQSNSPFAADPFFRYFFGEQDDVFGTRDRRSLSLGSGVVISSDGYVVTNNHVVGDNMQQITVTLPKIGRASCRERA